MYPLQDSYFNWMLAPGKLADLYAWCGCFYSEQDYRPCPSPVPSAEQIAQVRVWQRIQRISLAGNHAFEKNVRNIAFMVHAVIGIATEFGKIASGNIIM